MWAGGRMPRPVWILQSEWTFSLFICSTDIRIEK
jgi:hypothetical protein